jgi:membrane fusion protein (multidrug efflux system)
MSDESVIVRPEVAGRIAQFHFREGERVARGALLVSLDDSIQAAQLEQAQAALALSRTNHERAVELFNRKAGTQRAVDEAVGAMRQDQARVRLQEAMVAKNQIRAPFAGVIGLRAASVGDYVNPGQAIVNLESIDTLKVDFRVPEVNLSTLAVGQKIEVLIDAFPGRIFSGEVFAIDPLVDRSGHAVVLRARIANAGGPLRPGMFARVTLIADSRDGVILVPEQAIEPRGDDQFVYRIVDGRALLTKVEVGQRRDAMVEIRQGLGQDDTVVTSGQIKLRDGATVRTVRPSS